MNRRPRGFICANLIALMVRKSNFYANNQGKHDSASKIYLYDHEVGNCRSQSRLSCRAHVDPTHGLRGDGDIILRGGDWISHFDRVARCELGRVDELFDTDPSCYQLNEGKKGFAQFIITRRNPAKLFEATEKPLHFLT